MWPRIHGSSFVPPRKFKHWLRIAAALLCLVTPSIAHAGVNVWTSNGPGGGSINALAIDTTSPDTLYASTGGNEVFKSTNGGASWSALNTPSQVANQLVVDPADPTVLYTTTA